MNQTTIDQFQDFLKDHGLKESSIAGYIRSIRDLSEPDDADDPELLLLYLEGILSSKKTILGLSSYRSLGVALRALFFMKTGILFKDYLKQRIPDDQYSPILEQYADYCHSFLNLTSVVTDASVRETRLLLETVIPDMNNVVWSEITATDIISFLEKKRTNLSVASIGVTVTAIRRFFRFLQHNDFAVHSSILKLPLSIPVWSKNNKLPVTLTPDAHERLTTYTFPDTPKGLRNRAILYCFTELGLRCCEVSNLHLTDVKWNCGTIVIRKSKTHAERELPMSIKLGQALEEYVLHSRPKQLGDHLFYKSKYRNEPSTPESVRSVIRQLYNKLDISGWHTGTHALRRTLGSHLYNSGNSLKAVADLLGHSSISATKAYVRIDIESLRSVASAWPMEGVL